MDIEGKLKQKLAVQNGTSARGGWAKQEFVIEYQDGNYPTKACFSVWGEDKVKDLERFQIEDPIKVSFNVSSREYNGKWYTDLRAWRIAPAGQQNTAGGSYGNYDAPAGFTPQAAPQAPAPGIADMPADGGDDLPF